MANKNGRRVPGSWCKACMSEQTILRQRKYKSMYVKQMGGSCRSCGFNRYYGALDFHHVDSQKKDSRMSKMTRSPDSPEIQAELNKCVLLCSNCHRMVHAGLIECPELLLPIK
jgi:predicted HNH restriction endonuclease